MKLKPYYGSQNTTKPTWNALREPLPASAPSSPLRRRPCHLSGSLLCCPFEVSVCACELACSERLRRRGAPCYAEGALVPDEQQSMVFSMLIL